MKSFWTKNSVCVTVHLIGRFTSSQPLATMALVTTTTNSGNDYRLSSAPMMEDSNEDEGGYGSRSSTPSSTSNSKKMILSERDLQMLNSMPTNGCGGRESDLNIGKSLCARVWHAWDPRRSHPHDGAPRSCLPIQGAKPTTVHSKFPKQTENIIFSRGGGFLFSVCMRKCISIPSVHLHTCVSVSEKLWGGGGRGRKMKVNFFQSRTLTWKEQPFPLAKCLCSSVCVCAYARERKVLICRLPSIFPSLHSEI